MIQLYTGVPGSGKSYKMVHDLANLLEKEPDINVISNIDNLKLPHTNFDELLEDLYPGAKRRGDRLEQFFHMEHQEKLSEEFGGPILYVLDECQLYFPRRGTMPNTEEYFQRHRHLGHYVLLASQAASLINRNLIPLIELEYHAPRRTISFFGEIRYKERSPQSPKQIIRSITLRPKQAIFDLYQSFNAAEIKKPKATLGKLFLLPLLLSPVFYLFYDKYLNIPEKPSNSMEQSSSGTSDSIQSGEWDGVISERNRLREQVSSLMAEIEVLSMENERLRNSLEQKVRVFLPVVVVGKRKLTVDPETGAVTETSNIKNRRVICVDGGNACYYDKPVYGGVQLLQERTFSYAPSATPAINTQPKGSVDNSAPGSFVDASIVPEPEVFRRSVAW